MSIIKQNNNFHFRFNSIIYLCDNQVSRLKRFPRLNMSYSSSKSSKAMQVEFVAQLNKTDFPIT